MPIVGLILKRCVDVIGSALALLACLPGFPIDRTCDSSGFTRSGPLSLRAHPGEKWRVFTCYKFRTMGTERRRFAEPLYSTANERSGVLVQDRERSADYPGGAHF